MTEITVDKTRKIIKDFAEEIKRRAHPGPAPKMAVVDFRNERVDGVERPVQYVPTDLLRFRKDNGRIASDVYSYEKNHEPLIETNSEHQKVIAALLKSKDPDPTRELKNSIFHRAQDEPAIITADGFLINGNRRKLVLQMLSDEYHDSKFDQMKVVILPGEEDPGGPPSYKEIEQIENRYQLQSTGKADYSKFDRAISVRRKIGLGMTLEEQLRDDPNYARLSPADLGKAVRTFKEEYLAPLECIDRYLETLGRGALYESVSGVSDKEGRWEAFLDYYKSVYKHITNEKKRIEMGISETEVGKIEDATFKIIRLREFPRSKVHQIVRELPKIIKNPDAKERLLRLNKIETDDKDLSTEEPVIADRKWANKNRTEIVKQVNNARAIVEQQEDIGTPISLLESILVRLKTDFSIQPLSDDDLKIAMTLVRIIEEKIKTIEKEIFSQQKKRNRKKSVN